MGDACRHANPFRQDDVVGKVVALSQGGRKADLTTRLARFRSRMRWCWDLYWLGTAKLMVALRRVVRERRFGLGTTGGQEKR